MKTLLILAISLFLFVSCDDRSKSTNDAIFDPPQPAEIPNITLLFPQEEELDGFEHTEISYSGDMVVAYPLPQFVESAIPHLFEYELVSNDEDGNWSPRWSGMSDLRWDIIQSGYLVPEKQYRAFFPDEEVVNTYNVKFLGYIRMYRYIEVVLPERVVPFQINSLAAINLVQNGEEIEAIPLQNFITDYVTEHKDSFHYRLELENDESPPLNWDYLGQLYWETGTETIYRLTSDNQLVQEYETLVNINLIPVDTRSAGSARKKNYLLY